MNIILTTIQISNEYNTSSASDSPADAIGWTNVLFTFAVIDTVIYVDNEHQNM